MNIRERHPVMLAHESERREKAQLRLADAITRFAGSMTFVYIHAVLFGLWCATSAFGADPFPFNLLTMVVSLEAIFLATFVMIGQNRQAALAAEKADHDYVESELELHENTRLTRNTFTNTQLIHLVAHELGIADADIQRALAAPEPGPDRG